MPYGTAWADLDQTGRRGEPAARVTRRARAPGHVRLRIGGGRVRRAGRDSGGLGPSFGTDQVGFSSVTEWWWCGGLTTGGGGL